MNCQEINLQLEAWLDQTLELPTAAKRHLAHCVECQAGLARLRALKLALQSVEPPAPSARLDERVMAAFQQQHSRAQATRAVGAWRAWLFHSFSLPKPALALACVLLVGTAVLAYKAGEIMGMSLPAIEPPVLVHNQITQPIKSTRVVYVKAPRNCTRPNSQPATRPQASLAKAADTRAVLRLETQAYASEAGIDYTTSAALENFEPVKDPSVRVIKGGNQ